MTAHNPAQQRGREHEREEAGVMSGQAIGTFLGMHVHVSEYATEKKPRFPDKRWSKRRRRRVIGKYGSWFKEFPACFILNGNYVMHPNLAAEMKRRTTERARA